MINHELKSVLIVGVLWAAGLGAAAQFGKISVLYDILGHRYAGAGGPIRIGLLVSVVGVIGLIFGTTAGLLVARIGPRRAIVGALCLGAIMSMLEASFPPYPLMIAARIFEGVSHLAIVVVGPTVIAAVAVPRYQGLAMTLWSSFFGVTYAALALFAPPLVAWGGPESLFLTHAAWLGVCAALLFVLLPSDPPPVVEFGQKNIIRQHISIYSSPFLAAPAMGFFCYTVLYVALLTLLPPMMPAAYIALVGTGMPLVSIAVSLTLGVWLLGRTTPVSLVQGGFAVAVIAMLGLWAVWGQGQAMVAATFLLAAALGIVQGASFASIPFLNTSPSDRAGAAGAVAQLGNLGTTTGTPLLALILAHSGATGVAIFVIPFCLLGIVLHVVQKHRRIGRVS
jgi:MFS transporter, DHA1 family, inner membrane transport protein